MPTYSYTARDSNAAPVSGTVIADTESDASLQLRRDGKYPVSITLAADDHRGASRATGGIRIARADVIQVSTQLAIMVETGVTLTEALECIAAQSEKPRVRELVEDLHRQVQQGSDFSSALARHARSFPQLYVALIRASEKSGMMGRMLVRATSYLRDEQETTRRVKGALVYPGIMFAFALNTTIFLLVFVLPRFAAIYANKKAALPAPTRILMAISDFLVSHYIALPAGVVALVLIGWFIARQDLGRRFIHWLQLRLPLIGPVLHKLHLSRSLRMVGTMAGAGVPLVDCVVTAQDLSTNTYYKRLWTSVLEKIQAGRQFCEPLFESRLVPRSVAQMIHSGEKSGKLAFVMEQISGFAEQELKERIAELTRYVEPAMIVLMGAIIGGVALALLLPVFTISRVMAQ